MATTKVQDWFRKGQAQLKLRRYAQANQSFEMVLRDDPSNSEAWYLKGLALSALRMHREALISYDNVIRLKPDDYIAWNNRGVTLGKLGRLNEAFKAYDKSVTVFPKYAKAWNNMGVAYGRSSQYEKAFYAYDRALECEPGYATAWNNRGVTLGKLKRYREAYDAYENALALNPNYKQAQQNIDDVLRYLRSEKRALTETDEVEAMSGAGARPPESSHGLLSGGPLVAQEVQERYENAHGEQEPQDITELMPMPVTEDSSEINASIFTSEVPAQSQSKQALVPTPLPGTTREPNTDGISVLYWNGDELPIQSGSGETPNGFRTAPGYKQFSRRNHKPGLFSYAPYYRIRRPGRFRVHWLMTFGNKAEDPVPAFALDIHDHDASETLWVHNVRCGDLARPSGGFSLHSPWVDIPVNQRLESRIHAGGGCDLRLYFVRWEIDPGT